MTEIIAEIGVNWCGDTQIAKDMILESKHSGADYVKFQMFNHKIIKDSKYKKELSEMILDHNDIQHFSTFARTNDIKFGVSVMYPEGLIILEEVRLDTGKCPVDFIKIRCQDRSNEFIARPAVKYCIKHDIPLLVSFDRLTHKDDYYKYNLYSNVNVNYLYCIPEYPPELKSINDSYIYPCEFDGYSNHYPSKYLPMVAVSRDMKFVEIHVRRDIHNFVAISEGLTKGQIDANVSIDFNDLREVCELRDLIKKIMR